VTRPFSTLLPLCAIAFLVLGGGCATTEQLPATDHGNRPETFLSGADIAQAKSVAMGSAVSKGWTIVDSAGNRVLVGRSVDQAEAASLVGAPVTSASLEVATDFLQRQGGVAVLVGATLIANKGSKSEVKMDFTDRYARELGESLDSLRRSWEENRARITSATPPPPARSAGPVDDAFAGTPDRPSANEPRQEQGPIAASAAEPQLPPPATAPEAQSPPPDEPQERQQAPQTPPESAIAAASRPPPASPAPVEERPTLVATLGAADSPPVNDMLVLERSGQPGVWAFYAEHYAKIRGCSIGAGGAVLEEKQPEYEIHRVPCENGQEFVVRCHAGTCRGLR